MVGVMSHTCITSIPNYSLSDADMNRQWSRKYDPTLWDCTTCFLNGDPRQAMPRGYEDVTTIAELRARKQKFDALELGTEPKSDELASGQKKNDP